MTQGEIIDILSQYKVAMLDSRTIADICGARVSYISRALGKLIKFGFVDSQPMYKSGQCKPTNVYWYIKN